MQRKLDKQDSELRYYKDKDLVLRCHDRIFSLTTVDLFADSLKDLAMESDGVLEMLHKHWNPFRRIQSEYEMRRQFAHELIANQWYFTATVDGKKCKCHLVPIDEFEDLYHELKNRTEWYERDHKMKVGGI